MKKISLRESLIKIDKETDFEHNLTAMYESCSLTEDEKEKLVKYVDAYDIDSMNKMLNNKFTSDITTTEDAAMMESYFEDGDISDDELASILGGDTKYDIPDGIETPEETEARLNDGKHCPSCGKPYDKDGRCYNGDCEQYDPLSQYFDEPDEDDLDEKWEPEFSDEWRPEDIELWKSIDWKARNYEPYIDETKKIRGEVKAVGLPGGTRTGEAMFAKEFSANPIFTPKWKPITDPFEGQGTNGWYMYDGVDADDGYMMMTRTETQEVSDMLSEALDDAEPYSREQIEAQLKELTDNFTRPMGEGRCGFKEEAIYSVDILEKYYEEVDMDKNGDWYDITFAKPITTESKSIKEGYRQDTPDNTYEIGDRVAQRWVDEFNVGTVMDIKNDEDGTQYLIEWDYADGPDAEWVYGDVISLWIEEDIKESKSTNEALDENPIIAWLGEHEQAWEDFTAHFSEKNIEELSDEEIIDWISEHDQLYDDYKNHFNINEASLTNSPLSTAGTIPYAVKLLYMMDKFVMDVYDNEYWLMDGVPDGEFEETTADEAQQNYKDHEWLITDFDGEFDPHELENFTKSFRLATDNKDYDEEQRNEIATAAEELVAEYLNSNESLNEDTNKIATKPNGDFLIAADNGKGFTAFNRDNVCIGGIDGDDAEEAKNKFLTGKLDENYLSEDFGEECLEEAADEDKQAVIEFAKDCRESGHPVEDYREFASILKDEGMTPSESLYQVYLDAYNEAE